MAYRKSTPASPSVPGNVSTTQTLTVYSIFISLLTKRKEVNQAKWTLGNILGPIVNVIALLWIAGELILFSMPTALPVTPVSMNYYSVVLVGFGAIAAIWYGVHSRKGMRPKCL